MEIYLDNAATTQVCPEARDAACEAMTVSFANPSSTHTAGRRAKQLLDKARTEIAGSLGCAANEVYFTSGGTESDNWAVFSGAEMSRRFGMHIISSVTEHDAVRKPLEKLERMGFEVTLLRPDQNGAVSPEAVGAALREDTVLVSLMLVNNETGSVTDIAGVSKLLKASGSRALLHTDAVQGFCKLPFTPSSLGADLASVSGHKIHAPKGVGALYIRNGLRLPPYLLGGGQENGSRSGTEAIPAIAAFGAAAHAGHAAMAEAMPRISLLRQHAIRRLTEELRDVVLIGDGAPHILCLSLPGYRSEVLMNYLERREIYVSRGSACKKGRRSHVLEAFGLPARVIDGALRISFSRFTTQEEVDALCDGLAAAQKELLFIR